jgi:hypothetical protein
MSHAPLFVIVVSMLQLLLLYLSSICALNHIWYVNHVYAESESSMSVWFDGYYCQSENGIRTICVCYPRATQVFCSIRLQHVLWMWTHIWPKLGHGWSLLLAFTCVHKFIWTVVSLYTVISVA